MLYIYVGVNYQHVFLVFFSIILPAWSEWGMLKLQNSTLFLWREVYMLPN